MISGWIVLGIAALMFLCGWCLGFAYGLRFEESDYD
jgi:hypothetical protein